MVEKAKGLFAGKIAHNTILAFILGFVVTTSDTMGHMNEKLDYRGGWMVEVEEDLDNLKTDVLKLKANDKNMKVQLEAIQAQLKKLIKLEKGKNDVR